MIARTLRAALAATTLLAMVLIAPAAWAHVGSPDIVHEGTAGPYHLVVTIQPPDVVPGIATIDVRVLDDGVDRVAVVPLPLRGEGVSSPPAADVARRSDADPHDFTSALWLMQVRPWQVRISVDGAQGHGTAAVPVPALASAVRPMGPGLTLLLFALLVLIVVGGVAIAGAAAAAADLPPGEPPDGKRRARGVRAMAIAGGGAALLILGGGMWWSAEAASYRKLVYKPLAVTANVADDKLTLTLRDPGWLRWRRTDDFVPDHGHLMHLFMVREPQLDAVAHLHPLNPRAGTFVQSVPPLGGGAYRIFGDVVHATGLDETVTARVDLPGAPRDAAPAEGLVADRFDRDDAVAFIHHAATADAPRYAFDDGSGSLRWVSAQSPVAGVATELEFVVDGPDGKPVDAIQAYMGMAAHAMVVARDLSVFAHVHPTGSVPMAALALVEGVAAPIDHTHHAGMTFGPTVSVPYAFPRPGDYRVFVQIKRDGRVQTGAFDVTVTAKR
jgi:hypothetical protein